MHQTDYTQILEILKRNYIPVTTRPSIIETKSVIFKFKPDGSLDDIEQPRGGYCPHCD